MKYYNLPGKLLAEFWYLWSKDGELWASGRRRKHPFVHFFYSTVIYIILGFLAYLWLTDWRFPESTNRTPSELSSFPESSAADQTYPSADENPITESEQADPETPLAQPAEEALASPSPEATEVISLPPSEVRQAMTAAFESGQPVRWQGSGTAGYAVPSDADARSGCRQVYYSDDNRPGWTSSPQKICP